MKPGERLPQGVLIFESNLCDREIMSRENPARYASLLFIKVLWKILAIFFGTREIKQ